MDESHASGVEKAFTAVFSLVFQRFVSYRRAV
jgi:hypothetical protein